MIPDGEFIASVFYRCGTRWHFERTRDGLPQSLNSPWYEETTYRDDETAFEVGEEVYIHGFKDGPFRIEALLRTGFYILDRTVGLCKGRSGRLEDKLWDDDDLSKEPWDQAALGPPPPNVSAGSAASTERVNLEIARIMSLRDK